MVTLNNNHQGILLFLSILLVTIPLIATPASFTPEDKYIILIIGAVGAALSQVLGAKSNSASLTDPLANQSTTH